MGSEDVDPLVLGTRKTVYDYEFVGTAHPDTYAKAVVKESGRRFLITMKITRLTGCHSFGCGNWYNSTAGAV